MTTTSIVLSAIIILAIYRISVLLKEKSALSSQIKTMQDELDHAHRYGRFMFNHCRRIGQIPDPDEMMTLELEEAREEAKKRYQKI